MPAAFLSQQRGRSSGCPRSAMMSWAAAAPQLQARCQSPAPEQETVLLPCRCSLQLMNACPVTRNGFLELQARRQPPAPVKEITPLQHSAAIPIADGACPVSSTAWGSVSSTMDCSLSHSLAVRRKLLLCAQCVRGPDDPMSSQLQ